ncbi:hypothetical protein Taro_040752, partial [Colocasia esculenta]|nr:hypothetical protein [Colocasia esculenta]
MFSRWSRRRWWGCRACQLVVLYGSIVKKKWVVKELDLHGALCFHCHVDLLDHLDVQHVLRYPLLGQGQCFLTVQSTLPASARYHHVGAEVETPAAAMVYFVDKTGVPNLVHTKVCTKYNSRPRWSSSPCGSPSPTPSVPSASEACGGFLFQWGVIVRPPLLRHRRPHRCILGRAYVEQGQGEVPTEQRAAGVDGGRVAVGGGGRGTFNDGDPYSANVDASMAVLNTDVCADTILLVWTCLNVVFFGEPSIIGAVRGMIIGLVCITPGA